VGVVNVAQPRDLRAIAHARIKNDWLDAGASSPEGAVVICRKPCILRLETGLTAVCYPFTRRVEAHADLIRRTHATWVLVDEVSSTTTDFLVPALDRLPWRLRLVHEVGGTRAYRIENR